MLITLTINETNTRFVRFSVRTKATAKDKENNKAFVKLQLGQSHKMIAPSSISSHFPSARPQRRSGNVANHFQQKGKSASKH